MNITLQAKAEEMLRNKLAEGQFLRVSVVKGGCAGLTYEASLDSGMKDGDEVVVEKEGVRVVSDAESRQFLDGLSIDYSDDLINGGLQFTNANTERSCGCGASFSLAGFPVIDDTKCRN